MNAVQECPIKKKVLEVQVVDKNQHPVSGVAISLRNGGTEVRRSPRVRASAR
jgi:hypothetical protein